MRPSNWVRVPSAEVKYKRDERTVRQWQPENGGRNVSIMEVNTPYGDYYRLQLYEGWTRFDTLEEAIEAAEEWMSSE